MGADPDLTTTQPTLLALLVEMRAARAEAQDERAKVRAALSHLTDEVSSQGKRIDKLEAATEASSIPPGALTGVRDDVLEAVWRAARKGSESRWIALAVAGVVYAVLSYYGHR